MRISIEAGGTTTQLGTKPVFQFKAASLEAIGNDITITPVIGSTAADNAYIKSINGSQPNGKGEFFIDGSECVSWGEVKNGVVVGGRPDETAEHDGMWLVDLCPSCTTCENVYRLKYEVETLKMWINTLKDVNLYQDADVEGRRTGLGEYRITGSTIAHGNIDFARCSTSGLQPDDGYLAVKGLQLLQQYMTTVHMWNYVVKKNNESTVIQTAPEDTAAFVVQTKRALTSCGDEYDPEDPDSYNSIKCTISVKRGVIHYDDSENKTDTEIYDASIAPNYPLSMFVPEPELRFEPFNRDFESKALGNATVSVDTSTATPCYRKVVTTEIVTKIAGTYIVEARFMPFIYVRCTDADGELIGIRGTSVYGGTVTAAIIGGTQTEHGDYYPFGISGATISTLTNPTEQDYLDAKRVPSCSVAWKIAWTIDVSWITKIGSDIKTETETYIFMCNSPRAYFGNSVMMDTTLPTVGSSVTYQEEENA